MKDTRYCVTMKFFVVSENEWDAQKEVISHMDENTMNEYNVEGVVCSVGDSRTNVDMVCLVERNVERFSQIEPEHRYDMFLTTAIRTYGKTDMNDYFLDPLSWSKKEIEEMIEDILQGRKPRESESQC